MELLTQLAGNSLLDGSTSQTARLDDAIGSNQDDFGNAHDAVEVGWRIGTTLSGKDDGPRDRQLTHSLLGSLDAIAFPHGDANEVYFAFLLRRIDRKRAFDLVATGSTP